MIMMTWFTSCSWSLEGGPPGNSWWGHPGSPNPVPILDQKMSFSTPVFRLRSSCFIFVSALSQFSGPNYLRGWNRLGLIRQKLCHPYQIRVQTKNSSKVPSATFHLCFSFLYLTFIQFLPNVFQPLWLLKAELWLKISQNSESLIS